MSARPVARLTDLGDHGGMIISASPDVTANSLGVARIGDTFDCAIHGPNPLVTGAAGTTANSSPVVRLGDFASCGAAIVTASPDVEAG